MLCLEKIFVASNQDMTLTPNSDADKNIRLADTYHSVPMDRSSSEVLLERCLAGMEAGRLCGAGNGQ